MTSINSLKNYKYILYISDFVHNTQYSKLMSFNSLIIKIKSNTKDWLSNYLKAYDFRSEMTNINKIEEDHTEINTDELSDLVKWLENNDKKYAKNC